jgi:transcriptional regulator with GAF, ATPase, and Fis domain
MMKPRIISLAGPVKGVVFELPAEDLTVGRDPSNHLSIKDKSLSRYHCHIVRENGKFIIRDLESHNGTFVNSLPVREQELSHGDHIQVGDSLLLFLSLEEKASEGAPAFAQLDNGALNTRSTIRLRLEDALYLIARDLEAVIRAGAMINATHSFTGLRQKLLEAIFEIVPAERGAIILFNGNVEEPSSVFALDKFSHTAQPFQISRTVVCQVMREGLALLSNDITENDSLNSSESLIASKIASLICVPLALLDRKIGILYLDTQDPAKRFTEGDLQMASTLASITAGALESAYRIEWLESENERLLANIQIEHNMIGESRRMQEVYDFIARSARTDSTVLIRGESGTGKELAARAIHHNSDRSDKPFMAVNCAALTETLLESELFGHEKGAFTGAIAQKKGKLEVASGGTVFLDEVGEMALPIQAKLLRVLQEREFERVGGTRLIKTNIRIIAATNKDLEEAIKKGAFRQDLFYRLNVLPLPIPSLRERVDDIPLLANYFTAKYSEKCKRKVTGLTSEARECLLNYDWPGNVRELENAIERAIVLGQTDQIQLEDLPEAVAEAAPSDAQPDGNYYELVKQAKRRILTNTLEQAGGRYTTAAKMLGIHPNNLHRLMRNLNLKP